MTSRPNMKRGNPANVLRISVVEIFAHRSCNARIGFDHARIDREAFALDEPRIHARSHHRLEELPEDVAITEAPVPIDRERRVIGHRVLKIEAAKPPIGEMKLDLLARTKRMP